MNEAKYCAAFCLCATATCFLKPIFLNRAQIEQSFFAVLYSFFYLLSDAKLQLFRFSECLNKKNW